MAPWDADLTERTINVFSQTAEYALRAMVCLAQQREDRSLTSQELAEATQVPPGYLSKVLHSLVRGGLIRSRRGVGGGFILARPADTITILDVLNIVDPMQRITFCPLGLQSHGTRLCPLHRKLDDAIARTEEAFSQITLAMLVNEPTLSPSLCELPAPNPKPRP